MFAFLNGDDDNHSTLRVRQERAYGRNAGKRVMDISPHPAACDCPRGGNLPQVGGALGSSDKEFQSATRNEGAAEGDKSRTV